MSNEILLHLINCKGGKNEAVALYEAIEKEFPIEDPFILMHISKQIEDAIKQGEEQVKKCELSYVRLQKSLAQPAKNLVPGF